MFPALHGSSSNQLIQIIIYILSVPWHCITLYFVCTLTFFKKTHFISDLTKHLTSFSTGPTVSALSTCLRLYFFWTTCDLWNDPVVWHLPLVVTILGWFITVSVIPFCDNIPSWPCWMWMVWLNMVLSTKQAWSQLISQWLSQQPVTEQFVWFVICLLSE